MFSWQSRTTSKAAPRRSLAFDTLEDRCVPVTGVTDLSAGTLTATDLARRLVGPGLSVSNVSYTGAAVAAGVFAGGARSIGYDTGVVLGTGRVALNVGPNVTTATSVPNGTAGDPALSILAGAATFDAAILEFDVVTPRATLAINYVFGSDEYPEFVAATFNDSFAIYIDGVRSTFIPGTNTPVSIDTVNIGMNRQFFVPNFPGPTRNVEMDGLTVPITNVVSVQAGVPHRIRIAIADASDSFFDSNLFLPNGAISSPNLQTFNPLRFAYNSRTNTYDGRLYVKNAESYTIPGPVYLHVALPSGATLANPTITNSSGKPYIQLPGTFAARQSLFVDIRVRNPGRVPLGTFFLNNTRIEVTNILT